MTLLKKSQRSIILLLAVIALIVLNIFQLFRAVEKSMVVIQETTNYPGQTALLVGTSNRKLSYVLTSFPVGERPALDEKVAIVLPNKSGKDNQKVVGVVAAEDSSGQLSLIKLDKKVKRKRSLEFITSSSEKDDKVVFLEKKAAGHQLSDYYLAKDREVTTLGLTPILNEQEKIIGLYTAENKLVSAKDAVAFLAKHKVTVHANGSKKQELLLSSFAAFNVVVLYVLLILHRRRKKGKAL